jgi:hypothetical protein
MGIYGYLILTLGPLTKGFALIGAFRRPWRELFCVKAYLAFSVGVDCAQLVILQRYGFVSSVYRYSYYLSDLALTVAGFFVLARLLELAFDQTRVRLPNIRAIAVMVFSGLATISAYVVFIRLRHSIIQFSDDLEQNLSFVGMILTVVLWIAMNVMLVPGLRFRRVVLAFSILYSSGALVYTFQALLGNWAIWRGVIPLAGLATAALFAYTLWTDDIIMTRSRLDEIASRVRKQHGHVAEPDAGTSLAHASPAEGA